MRRSIERRWAVAFLVLALAVTLMVPAGAGGATATLSGVVTDRTGAGVADVAVELFAPGITQPVLASTVTGTAGDFAVMVDDGTYDVRFTPPAGSGLTVSTVQAHVVAGASVLDVVLASVEPPPETVEISGVLRDEDGVPRSGWEVHRGWVDSSTLEDVTGPDGAFSFVVESGATVLLRVTDGVVTVGGVGVFDEDTSLDLVVRTVDVEVAVVDPDGNPVADAPVDLRFAFSFSDLPFGGTTASLFGEEITFAAARPQTATTDSTGRVGFTVLDAVAWHEVSVSAPPSSGLVDAAPEKITATEGLVHTVTLPLDDGPATVAVTGRLADDDGVPLAGWGLGNLPADFGGVPFATTEPDGTFAFVRNPDPFTLVIGDGSWEFASFGTVQFTEDTHLDLAVTDVALTVRVVDPRGAAVAGATVTAAMTPGVLGYAGTWPLAPGMPAIAKGSSTGPTDGEGEVVLEVPGSPAATGRVSVVPPAASGLAPADVTGVGLDADGVVVVTVPDVVVAPDATVSGVVRDDEGAPIAGWGFYETPSVLGGGPPLAVTGADGSYSFAVPEGDRVGIDVAGDGWYVAGTRLLTVSSDTALDLTVHDVELAVTVTDSHGDPVVGAVVASAGQGGTGASLSYVPAPPLHPALGGSRLVTEPRSAVTDGAGVAALTLGESTTPVTLVVTPPANTNLPEVELRGVTVDADRAVQVLVASLDGTLSDAEGAPLGNQAVSLAGPGAGGGDDTVTAADGGFSLTVDPGLYALTVGNGTAADDDVPSTYEVAVADVDLHAARSVALSLPLVDLEVEVIDSAGAPVPAAIVRLPCTATSFDTPIGLAAGEVCDERLTGADGIARLRLLPTDAVQIEVVAPPGSGLAGTAVALGTDPGPGPHAVALPPLTVRPGSVVVVEGDRDLTHVELPVSLSGPVGSAVTVAWEVVDTVHPAVAHLDVDVVADRGVVTFAPGETDRSVGISVIGDEEAEPPFLGGGEWALVRFTAPSGGATIDRFFFGLGVVVIADDD